jgi:predicted permease
MDSIWKDFRVAARQFRQRPGYALAVAGTLALALGANIAVFTVVHAVLFRALPFRDSGRLLWIVSVRNDNPAAPFTLPEFIDYRGRTRTLSGLAAYANWRASLAGEDVTESLQGARMSANAFDVLGVTPVVGRTMQESDDRPEAPKVAWLSYRLWQRRFGGASGAVGKSVRMTGESYVIAGVLPPHFPLPLRDIDVVIPLVPDRDPTRYIRNSVNFLRFFGRLERGASASQSQAELTAICRSLRQQFPKEYARKNAVRVMPLREALIGDYRQPMLLLLGAVAVVLAAALANLWSLALVRAYERRAELCIRIVLGASRVRLVRQLAVESLLLALTGSAAGGVFAAGAVSAAVTWAPASIPRLGEAGLDGTVLGLAILLAVLVTALLSTASLGAALNAREGEVLQSSRGSLGGRWNRRVRQVLVTGEIAAAAVLLLTTTILLKNLRRMQDVRPGFSPDAVLQAQISIPLAYKSADDLGRFHDRLSERLAMLPGVQSVGLTSVAPLSGLLATSPFTVEGEAQPEHDQPNANLRIITPGYLEAAGTRLIAGRTFSETDRSDTVPVALVSAAFGARFLHGAPIGRRLRINDNNRGPRPVEVVGVVEDVREEALDAPPAFSVYLPLRQAHPDRIVSLRSNQFLMIRTRSNPMAVRSAFLTQLRAVDPDAAVAGVSTMRQYVDASLGPRRFNLGLFAAFSLTGVVLAVSGLYSLVSYTVSQRRQEIGLRMAVGASERDIHRMILRQAIVLGVGGSGLGAGLAALTQPLVSHIARDAVIPWVSALAASASLLALVIVAAWVPARRAARTSPTVALRGE